MLVVIISTIQLVFILIIVFNLVLLRKVQRIVKSLSLFNSFNKVVMNDKVRNDQQPMDSDKVFKDLGNNSSNYRQYNDKNSLFLKTTLVEYDKLVEGNTNELLNHTSSQINPVQLLLTKIRPSLKPIMKLSCGNCTPISRENFTIKNDLTVINNMLKPQQQFHRDNRFLPRFFNHLYPVCMLEKIKYVHIGDEILSNTKIKEVIDKTTLQQLYDGNGQNFTDNNYLKLLKQNENRARSILMLMKSKISGFLLKFVSWILYKLLPYFLTNVRVRPDQITVLKKACITQNPIIFLPVHKSHLDYILISFILLNNNIRPPLVAAGDNLRLPFFGYLLRGLGAFFIKRRISPIMGNKDLVYKTVLQVYMDECLKAGHNIEFFLEGGRTRTGKICMPKYGILSVIVDACVKGVIDDAYLVPIGINYEKLVDGNFVRELLGQPKEMETFWSALKGIWTVLNSNYGSVQVDFGQPFSLRELIRTFQKNSNSVVMKNGFKKQFRPNASISSIYGTDVVHEEWRQIVENISRHVLWDCANTTAIMSTNTVAFLLLTRYRNGATINEFMMGFRRLLFDLKWDERNLGFDSVEGHEQLVEYVCKLLGPKLIEVTTDENNVQFIRPILELETIIELSYYSNIIVHNYTYQSILANVILNAKSDVLNENEIVDDCLELCDVLQYEFIFCKPCQDLSSIFTFTLESMIATDEVLYVESNNGVHDNDVIDDGIELLPKRYKKDCFFDNSNRLKYLKTILEPQICTYVEVSESLLELIDRPCSEKDFIKNLLVKLKIKWKEGSLIYAESISVDAMKNALKLFQKWAVIDCQTRDDVTTIFVLENVEILNNISAKIKKFC